MELDANELKQELSKEHSSAADTIVEWYLSNLPESYFQKVGKATQKEHVKALVVLKSINIGSQQDIELTINSENDVPGIVDVTQMRADAKPGVLRRMFDTILADKGGKGFLHRVQAFSALDDTLTLNIFTMKPTLEPTLASDADIAVAMARHDEFAVSKFGTNQVRLQQIDSKFVTKEALESFFRLCPPWYVRSIRPVNFACHRMLYERIQGTEDTIAQLDIMGLDTWIVIVAAHVTPAIYLAKLTRLLLHSGISVTRLQMDVMSDPTTMVGVHKGHVAMIRILVTPGKAETLPAGVKPFEGTIDDVKSEAWSQLLADICRVRYLDETTLDLGFSKCPGLGLQRAEILDAFCAMVHGPLSKINAHGFSRNQLVAAVAHPLHTAYASDVADLFSARFNPKSPMADNAFGERLAVLRERANTVHDETASTLMLKMLDVVENTLRTNLFFPSRSALALRLDPSIMVMPEQVMPFGVFFVHGDCFHGFHNRFQNIARGGLRLVTPPSHEQCLAESSKIYDEVYSLSFAQNLKNKDIPEGGSKAVCLIDASRTFDKYRAMRASLKAFTNSILDLIVTTGGKEFMVDRLGVDEPIFLGPDEQVVPEDIDWIIQQAGKRGYSVPAAFMSSKPKAGINHKTYGVTSEGVAVFLDVALRHRGIEPDKQPFTIKITGGPDGDVGGNLLRILIRDYGTNMQCVGIADGSGCVEDPAGLSHSELMRLFAAGLPICDIDPETLSPQGMMHKATTEEGSKMRNTMHNRLKADVFVPAGGRPSTMHKGNWEQFLDGTGQASSPLIVEGANIFITPEARQLLFDKAGVQIVKDSSANKCGVITSSFEICASMLLGEEEFLAIKDDVVKDVLKRLRELARLEAELMFREYQNYPGALPHFSERISKSINRAYAAIRKKLADVETGDETYRLLLPLFLNEHLPRKLAEAAGDRVTDRIPLDYLRNAFGKILASKLLYREGIHFLESQPEDRLPELALRYVTEEKQIQELVGEVESSDLPPATRAKIQELLNQGGTRSLLGIY